MSNMQQVHGNFIPGGSAEIFGKVSHKIKWRVLFVSMCADRLDSLKAAHDEKGLIKLAKRYERNGAATTAKRIRLMASEM